jgi:hypothetical protein
MTMADESITAALVASALQLADRAVVCDVEDEGIRHPSPDSARVYDITTMFDPREHSSECLDMASQAIAYGVSRGLFKLLPGPCMLVRMLPRAAAP